MLSRLLIAAVSSAVLGLACSATAETLYFNYVEQGGINFSYEQDSAPTPDNYSTNNTTEVPITFVSGDIGPYNDMGYHNGTYTIGGLYTPDTLVTAAGPQLYSGSETNPIFAPGSFALYDITDSESGKLTVTDVVPEPSTWALMLLGVGALGLSLRRRSERSALAA